MKKHVILCKSRNEKQHIRYPIEGKNIDKFTNFRLMNKLQFYVSADAECSLLPIKEPDQRFLDDEYDLEDKNISYNIKQEMYKEAYSSQNFPIKGSTSKNKPTQLHRLNSIGWKLYVDEEISTFPRKAFEKKFGGFAQVIMAEGDSEKEEERLVDRFMKWLNEASEFIRIWLKKINDKHFQARILERLKRENPTLIREATHCIYCKQKLIDPRLDHCHLTFKSEA